MKQLQRSLSLTGLFLAAFLLIMNMESCSSHKGIVSCPDVHHRNLAMHHVHYHNGNMLARNHHKDVTPQQADNTPQPTKADASPAPSINTSLDNDVSGGGLASSSNELPKFKSPKEIYKLLTEDERQEVKSTVSKVLAKHPFMKGLAERKMERMDKKYPAPAKSVFKSREGGELSTGEILAIVAIVFAVLLPIVGLILGIIALHRINMDGGADWARILAIVAIVLGAIALLALIIALAVIISIGVVTR